MWKKYLIEDQAEQDKMLTFCRERGFNRLFLQIPWHRTDDPAKPEIELKDQIRRLIAEAAKSGIAVEALDGAPEMGRKSHWPATLGTLDAILAFNETLPTDARFVGVHWDIEPYTRPSWKTAERPAIMLEYLQLLAQAKQTLHQRAPGMTLAVDIPMWYDNRTTPDDNCVLEFDGQTKNFHQHIQDLTDYVGIMSYRQHALGDNSVTYHVANEMAYAERIGKSVCPALETIELKATPTITFFGQPPATFLAEKQKVEDALKDHPGFGGVLVHNYPSVRNLLESNPPPAR